MADLDLAFLPTLNAALNGLATLLLLAGYVLIRAGKRDAHKRCMLGAFATSVIFLGCYLLHKAWKASVGDTLHTTFAGQGAARAIYLVILLTHLVLAMAVPVLAVLLIRWGLTRQWEKHKRLARWAWPVWLYVSVTGVVIYLMLYHWPTAAQV